MTITALLCPLSLEARDVPFVGAGALSVAWPLLQLYALGSGQACGMAQKSPGALPSSKPEGPLLCADS